LWGWLRLPLARQLCGWDSDSNSDSARSKDRDGGLGKGGWRVAQLPANPKGECEFVRLAIRDLRGTFEIATYAIIGVTLTLHMHALGKMNGVCYKMQVSWYTIFPKVFELDLILETQFLFDYILKTNKPNDKKIGIYHNYYVNFNK